MYNYVPQIPKLTKRFLEGLTQGILKNNIVIDNISKEHIVFY